MSLASTLVARVRTLLGSVAGQTLERSVRAERAIELAELLLALSRDHTEPDDARRARMLARMMRDPAGQLLTTALTDRVYRSKDPRRVLEEAAHLLRTFGIPRYMRFGERAALLGVRALAPLGLAFVARAMIAKVGHEARSVLLDAAAPALDDYLARRRRERVRVNFNQLGEALLGEQEAEERVATYIALASRQAVDAISVKVSSIGSQLDLLAFEATTATLAARLARIYDTTLSVRERERTLVMLDMESYAQLELTLAVLTRALADPEHDRVRAGIVLQAYLPDASDLYERVTSLARERTQRGGLPLRVRIVKGANLAHERVESAKAGVTVPIFADKRQVDAHYKRLLERALTPEATQHVHVGVASHNLFDLAYALVLRAERRVESAVELELLEGMAEPVRRALSAIGADVLVYAPICRDDELNSGIAYLVRRLDENTAPENYLRSSFELASRDAAQEALMRERARFVAAVDQMDELDLTPRRAHDPGFDRTRAPTPSSDALASFRGEPDTDFSRAENRAWIRSALARTELAEPRVVRSVVAGSEREGGRIVDGVDPSRPGVVPYRIALGSAETIEAALACASRDPAGFSQTNAEQRAHLLVAAAAALRDARAELIALMVLDAGKRVIEADVEVSEAIDFANYYRTSYLAIARNEPVTLTPRGTILVTPPWNFPLAIAAGGIFAALMAGCRVLFKPALETPLVGERLAQLLWQAGIPREALQLVVCDDEVASALVRDRRVASVILTGATETARLFQRLRPGLRLLAETGGKNAYVVSALSDRELAIHDVVHSAFGHAGQKCSAASLLILEAEVHDDPHFLRTLRDAVESLHVGSAWDPESFVTPLIRPPGEALARALGTLEPGESWLVEPRFDAHAPQQNPRLVRPGVKLGVRPGSFVHCTELFGPVLAVMRADSLMHAIELANQTGYGLTGGLASLDEREQATFLESMRAGNLYVNRTITGAIVERQPFGGIGNSGFGPGAKAGGPNYVVQLCHVRENPRTPSARAASTKLPDPIEARVVLLASVLDPSDAVLLRTRAHDYLAAMHEHFAREHDPAAILGQYNFFRYRPSPSILLRVEADAALIDVASSIVAAEITGVALEVSMDAGAKSYQDATVLGAPLEVEAAEAIAARKPHASRLRLLGTRSPALDLLNRELGIHIADEPVLSIGRFELLHYLTEQSVSIEYHRYGNLGAHALAERSQP